jgi:excisionase family DNA binding protein
MLSMATRWSDADIAASLNRMGMRTGQGKTWTAHRVSSLRRVHEVHAYRSAEKNGEWLTMSEAAAKLGVTNRAIRRLIKGGILAAEQVVPGAPYQIRATHLQSDGISASLDRKAHPCRDGSDDQMTMFPGT